jgi:hypothetical protein
MEVRRSHGTKAKLTLEIEAETPSGLNDAAAGLVHHEAAEIHTDGFSD